MLLSLTAARAGAQITLKGRVIDADNRPVEYATVRVAGTATGTQTSAEGTYRLSCGDTDTLRVVFSCVGYRTEQRQLVNPSGVITLNMRLVKEAKALKEVERRELRKQTGTMERLDASSYRRAADATGGSIESMLATMPGVHSSSELSSQYSVRGGSYDENNVYINGMEQYRPLLISTGQQEGLSVINPHMVGAIGFSTGGFSAEYADRMSSTLDITYRVPEEFEGSVEAGLNGGGVTIGQASHRFSQLHGVRYKRNTSLLGSLESKGEYDPDFFDYQTSLTLAASKRVKLSFLGNIGINNYRFTPTDRETKFGTSTDAKQFKVYFDGREKDRFETWAGGLTLEYALTRSTTLAFMAAGFLTNELVAYDIAGEYWLDDAGTSGSSNTDGIGGELGVGRYHEHARNRLKYSVLTGDVKGATRIGHNVLRYGATMKREQVTDRSREWELRDSAGYSLPSDGTNVRMIYNLQSHQDLSSTRLSAFIQDTWQHSTDGGFLTLTAGLRATYWDFNGELLISPRVSIGYIPASDPRWALRAATGIYYQSPVYREFRQAVDDGQGNMITRLNDGIRSPRSIHVIGGADYTFTAFGRPFKLSGEAYYKALSRMIPYEIDNLKLTYSGVNETSGYAAGVDFKLFGQFVTGSDSWLSLSLMKSQENLHGVKVPLPEDRRYSLSLYFTDFFPKIPRLKFSLRGVFSDGLPAVSPHSGRDKGYFRLPAYKRADVGFAYGILTGPTDDRIRRGVLSAFRSIWIGIDVFNLFDISNVSDYYWVTDVNAMQYAVPNYLTRRQLNIRLSVDF